MEQTLIEIEIDASAMDTNSRRFANIATAQFIEVFIHPETGQEGIHLDYGLARITVCDPMSVQRIKAFLRTRI